MSKSSELKDPSSSHLVFHLLRSHFGESSYRRSRQCEQDCSLCGLYVTNHRPIVIGKYESTFIRYMGTSLQSILTLRMYLRPILIVPW